MAATGPLDERSELMRGAWAVLRRSGFEGFKVQLVLRESGLSARTFYRHFPDKEHLFLALTVDEYSATARRLWRATAAAGSDPEERVRAWITELLLSAGDPERLPRTRLFSAHHSIMERFPNELADATAQLTAPLVQAIDEGRAAGLFAVDDSPGDAARVARLVSGTLTETVRQPAIRSDMAALISSTVDFAMRALGARSRRGGGVAQPRHQVGT